MRSFRTLGLLAGPLSVLLAAGLFLWLASSACFSSTEQPFSSWGIWEAYSLLELEARRGEQLEVENKQVVAAWKTKDQIARDWIAGRLPFAETVVQFREVGMICLEHLRANVELIPGDSPKERWSNYVCNWIRNMPISYPERETVLARLVAEQQEYLASAAARQPAATSIVR